MSLYTKGPWARFTFEKEDMRKACEVLMGDTMSLFKASAFVAKTRLLANNLASTAGINPAENPRADEQEPFERPRLERYYHPAVAKALQDNVETPWVIIAGNNEEIDLIDDLRFGANADQFWLNEDQTKLGFWFVLHENTDLDDKNSLREQLAADMSHRPFKALSKPDQKSVNEELVNKMKTYAKRTQAAVFIDIENQELWVGTGSKKVIEALVTFFGSAVALAKTSLSFGGDGGWLKAFYLEAQAKDLYKLEHEEMVEDAAKAEAEATEEPEEEPEVWGGEEGRRIERDMHPTDVPEGDSDKKEYPSDSDCIAMLNLDEAGLLVSVNVPAVIAPTADSAASIGVKEFIDALMVLKAMQGSHVGAAFVTFKDRGGSSCTFELSAGLVTGPTLIWKALQPHVLMADLPSYEETSGMLHHWLVWFDSLRYCEKLIVHTLCTVLGLDATASNNGVVSDVRCIQALLADDEGDHDDAVDAAANFAGDLAAAGVTGMTISTPHGSTSFKIGEDEE